MESIDPIIPSVDPKKKFNLLRFVGRLIVTLLVLFFTLLGTAVILGYYYQDEVKGYVISELNKQLNTDIIVDGSNIDFTLIKKFPYASVEFRDVKALDAIKEGKKDTLFKAREISLQFSLLDIFRKNYKIRKIQLEGITLDVRIDKQGNDNYHFWKSSKDTSATNFAFELEKISVSELHLRYNNKRDQQRVDFVINKGTFSGAFSDQNYALDIDCNAFVNTIKVDSSSFLRKKNVKIVSVLNINNSQHSYKFENTKVAIESMQFEISGSVLNITNASILNVGVKAKNMDIQSVLSLIPAKYKGKINDYESEGEFYLDASIEGEYSQQHMPLVTAEFGIKNADILQIKDNVKLRNVNLKGSFSTGDKQSGKDSYLSIASFSAAIDQGSVSGNLKLLDLQNYTFDGELKANINLNELQKFFKVDTIESANGLLQANARFSGSATDISSRSYENIKVGGTLNLSDVSVAIKNSVLNFNNINADFDFDNNDLKINQFYGNISNSDFELDGYIRNFVGYVLKKNEDILVDASLKSKNIDLNELMTDDSNTEKGGSNNYKLNFSEHIDAELKLNIENLIFRKFNAKNINGEVRLKSRKMILDPVNLSTMNGNIQTTGYIDASDSGKVLITCFSDVNRINITKMFESFENFGQTAVTSKNIKGVATAKIQFASVLSPELKMDMDKLYAAVDMTIENGELNNVESMKSLSRFIELSELENIKFATLKNQIEIKDQTITMPKMEVKSNALNVYVSGTHTFKNEINYKIKLSLNELLAKKAKKAKKENDEFGEVADDGLGRTNIFLSMTGTIDDPVIKYDSKGAIQNVKQDLKVEKQNLKAILKEEFGLFKKDSTLNTKKKEEDTKFTIKWEEADKKEEPKKELKKPKKPEEEDF